MNFPTISYEDLTTPHTEPRVGFYTITPDVAAKVLETRAKNRTATPATWGPYLNDMLNSRWHINGQPIIFDTAGKLIDGQHRMSSLSEAGDLKLLPDGLPFLVVQGLEHSAMDTIDTGRKRSFADQVNIHLKELHGDDTDTIGPKVAAALRALYLIGQVGSDGSLGGKRLTSAQLQDLYSKHGKIADSIKLAYAVNPQTKKAMWVSPAVVAAVHYAVSHLIKGKKEDLAEQRKRVNAWVATLQSGVGDAAKGAEDPALALRELFAGHVGANRYSENEALKLVTWSWAYASDDATVSQDMLSRTATGGAKTKLLPATKGTAHPVTNPPVADKDGKFSATSLKVTDIAGQFLDVAQLRTEKLNAAAKLKAEEDAKSKAATADAIEAKPEAKGKGKKAAAKKAPAKKAPAKGPTVRKVKPDSANAHAAVPPSKSPDKAMEAAAEQAAEDLLTAGQ